MKKLFTFTLLAASAAFGQTCSNATLKGAYSYAIDGTATIEGKTIVNSEVGRLTFDGAGKFTAAAASTTNGVIAIGEASGDYAIGADCTMTGKTAEGLEFDAVVVNDGSDVAIMVRETGVTRAGTATKVDALGACSAATLNGSYGYGAQGSITANGAVISLGEIGILKFDGSSAVSGTYSASTAGVVERKDYSGTYEIAANCTGNAKFSIGGVDYVMNFVLTQNGNGYNYSIVGGGSVLTGSGARMFAK
jgi:hypothetical protein